jgi:hypothetical protein
VLNDLGGGMLSLVLDARWVTGARPAMIMGVAGGAAVYERAVEMDIGRVPTLQAAQAAAARPRTSHSSRSSSARIDWARLRSRPR